MCMNGVGFGFVYATAIGEFSKIYLSYFIMRKCLQKSNVIFLSVNAQRWFRAKSRGLVSSVGEYYTELDLLDIE
jgi:hypothetical protein